MDVRLTAKESDPILTTKEIEHLLDEAEETLTSLVTLTHALARASRVSPVKAADQHIQVASLQHA